MEPTNNDSDSDSETELAEAPNLNLNVQEKIKLLLLLATKKRHRLTFAASESIMKLSGVFSSSLLFTPSKHIMKNTIKHYSACVEEHHLCPRCGFYHGPADVEFQCSYCGDTVSVPLNKKEGNWFLYISVREQIKYLLESGLLDKLIDPKKRQKINVGSYEDIFDGGQYRTRIQVTIRGVTVNIFIDGVQVILF